MQFSHMFAYPESAVTYFAFTFPFSFQESLELTDEIERADEIESTKSIEVNCLWFWVFGSGVNGPT